MNKRGRAVVYESWKVVSFPERGCVVYYQCPKLVRLSKVRAARLYSKPYSKKIGAYYTMNRKIVWSDKLAEKYHKYAEEYPRCLRCHAKIPQWMLLAGALKHGE